MINKLIPSIITILVAVIMTATLLVPILSEEASSEKTFTNDGYFRMAHYGTDTDVTIAWSAENPKTMIVNDVAVPINYNVEGGQVTIVADTNFIVRLNASNTMSYIAQTGGTHTAIESATYVFSGGSASITNTSDGTPTTYTTTYEDIYVPSLNGEFVMKEFDKTAYVNEDSEIFAFGLTRIKNSTGTIASPGAGFEFSGSIADGIEGRIWRGSDNVTVANEQINYTAVDAYVDLYKFDSITATATYHETIDDEPVDTDTQVTYNYLLVPYQVTSEKTQHLSDSVNSLIMIIPVLVICAILIVAVRMIYLNGRD